MTPRPGLNPLRLARLMRDIIARCGLDLSGLTVFTEAATGVYAVTPVLAALAGAKRVYALAAANRHGSEAEARRQTLSLAECAGAAAGITLVGTKTADQVGEADIVTNSGNVRPIDAQMISWMKPSAVVALMYEIWEFRPQDIELERCRQRGIRVACTDERHPVIDVFSHLGTAAIKLLFEAGLEVYGNSLLILCDNPFLPFLARGLEAAGAQVASAASLADAEAAAAVDAVVVALTPKSDAVVIGAAEATLIAEKFPQAIVVQFWGDIDRSALSAAGVACWPAQAPGPGHMGILLSDVGAGAIVRLQAGGLRAAQALLRPQLGREYCHEL